MGLVEVVPVYTPLGGITRAEFVIPLPRAMMAALHVLLDPHVAVSNLLERHRNKEVVTKTNLQNEVSLQEKPLAFLQVRVTE